MPMTFKSGLIKPTKPVVLKNNMQMSVCFSGIIYQIKNITCRPNGVDFDYNGQTFRDVDFNQKGIEFV
jgi:hypothetical protein